MLQSPYCFLYLASILSFIITSLSYMRELSFWKAEAVRIRPNLSIL